MVIKTIQTDAIVRIDPSPRSRQINKKEVLKNLSMLDFDVAAWCCLCERTCQHTHLIEQISDQIKQHTELASWLRAAQDILSQNSVNADAVVEADIEDEEDEEGKDWLPAKLISELCTQIEESSEFEGMSGRLRSSAKKQVGTIYKSWFAAHFKQILRIHGKRRWLTVVESDIELAKISNFSESEIENEAEQILAQIAVEHEAVNEASGNAVHQLFNVLFARFDATENVLSRRAIILLLKNSGNVRWHPKQSRKHKKSSKRKNRDQPSKPKTLEERLVAKRVEIERLEQQLLSQLPRARNFFPDWAFEESLEDVVWSLPNPNVEADCIETEFLNWSESIPPKLEALLRAPKSLPYPIHFGYADVRSWQMTEAGKIFFKLNGWGDLIFEVRCHRRQLPLIKLFLQDWQTQHSAKENQYSGQFMLLRSIELLWKPKEKSEQSKTQLCSECQIFQQYPGGFWNECKLAIHWSYDSDRLTQAGLEQIRQRRLKSHSTKLAEKTKELQNKQELLSQLEKVDEASRSKAQNKEYAKLKKAIEKLQAELDKPRPDLKCLQNSPLFDRPDRPVYEGVPNIVVGVLLDLDKHIVLAVVDAKRHKLLAIRQARSISKEGHELLQQYFRQRGDHSKQRQIDQKAHRPNHQSESGLGQHIARLFAKGVVEVAQKYKASTIVLPETEGWRERLYSQLVARAKIKCSGVKKAMAQYTKAHGEKLHQWDYTRLAQAMIDCAATQGVQIVRQQTVYEEDAFQQAANLAIAGYNSLTSTSE